MKIEEIPKTLFHYCSLPKFLSITQAHEIWLSDLSKTNDSMEQEWIYHFLEQVVHYLCQQNLSTEENGNDLYQTYSSIFAKRQSDLDKKVLLNTVHLLQSMQEEAFIPCGLCMCTDGDLLSQWRSYADLGAGVAIGFCSNEFASLSSAVSTNLSFGPINYNLSDQINHLIPLVNKYFINTISATEKEKKLNAGLILSDIFEKALFFKNPAFAEEKEWRLLYMDSKRQPSLKEHMLQSTSLKLSERRWSTNGKTLTSYRALNFENAPNLISEIVLGPRCDISNEDISLFLQDAGYDSKNIRITRSSASLR